MLDSMPIQRIGERAQNLAVVLHNRAGNVENHQSQRMHRDTSNSNKLGLVGWATKTLWN